MAESGVYVVAWDGRRFPTTEWNGDQVVEALPRKEDTLPHLHLDMEERFPRARACEALVDMEPDQNDDLEMRGAQLERGQPEQEANKERDKIHGCMFLKGLAEPVSPI